MEANLNLVGCLVPDLTTDTATSSNAGTFAHAPYFHGPDCSFDRSTCKAEFAILQAFEPCMIAFQGRSSILLEAVCVYVSGHLASSSRFSPDLGANFSDRLQASGCAEAQAQPDVEKLPGKALCNMPRANAKRALHERTELQVQRRQGSRSHDACEAQSARVKSQPCQV